MTGFHIYRLIQYAIKIFSFGSLMFSILVVVRVLWEPVLFSAYLAYELFLIQLLHKNLLLLTVVITLHLPLTKFVYLAYFDFLQRIAINIGVPLIDRCVKTWRYTVAWVSEQFQAIYHAAIGLGLHGLNTISWYLSYRETLATFAAAYNAIAHILCIDASLGFRMKKVAIFMNHLAAIVSTHCIMGIFRTMITTITFLFKKGSVVRMYTPTFLFRAAIHEFRDAYNAVADILYPDKNTRYRLIKVVLCPIQLTAMAVIHSIRDTFYMIRFVMFSFRNVGSDVTMNMPLFVSESQPATSERHTMQ